MRDISTAQYRYRYYTEGLIWAFGDTVEAVSQLLLALKKSLLFGFEALFAILFLPFLNCWTASVVYKIFK